jgi:hypothetical protein
MTEVHCGFPVNDWVATLDASFSTGAGQQSLLAAGLLHSDALFWQHAIAAGVDLSQ